MKEMRRYSLNGASGSPTLNVAFKGRAEGRRQWEREGKVCDPFVSSKATD